MEVEATRTVLVIPVYEDSVRLAKYLPELLAELQKDEGDTLLQIVDDGSGFDERIELTELLGGHSRINLFIQRPLVLDAHRGKGAAIREGWAKSPDADYYAFVDCDGSISGAEMMRLITLARKKQTSVIASRYTLCNRQVEMPLLQRLSGFVFAAIARCLLNFSFRDTQCGAKVITGNAYRKLSSLWKDDGFTFDCELLRSLVQNGADVHEEPIAWKAVSGGKVSRLRDGFQMLKKIWRMR